MQALFVHGMGRTSLSSWPLLYQLQKAGLQTHQFNYWVSLQSFQHIQTRLQQRIQHVAQQGDYILIGHSLGGVLIRAALDTITTQPPRHVFLLGSPIQPARLAQRLSSNPLFRLLTQDCGRLLASAERMATIKPLTHNVTGIAGVRGIAWQRSPFKGEANDGVVALSEVSAAWLNDQIQIPVVHSWLPASRQVAEIIVQRLSL